MAAQQPSHAANASNNADGSTLERLRRTFSTTAKGYFSPQTSAPQGDKSSPSTPAADDALGGPTPFQRFMSLGKTRKDGGVEFPPQHWVGEEPDALSSDAANPDNANVAPVNVEAVAESSEPVDVEPEAVEPATLARRIQALLSRMPSPSSDQANTPTNTPSPPPPAAVSDPKLIALLSSPSIMNGVFAKGHQSVWSALDSLRAQLPGQRSSSDTTNGNEGNTKSEEVLDDDDSGVMLYGPLEPRADSEVELAKSETVPAGEEKKPEGRPTPTRGETLKEKLEGAWPFKGKEKAEEADDGSPSNARVNVRGKSKKVWIPSPDKISVEVMWWGYRIYLPPPVLNILDDKSIEGAKRAAMLTASLKWILNKVPLTMLPPQARPVMALLKASTPYLGYVGGFVAWSWGTVKRFDKGHGVTLTATWLLTVAVIPGTWEEKDFPNVEPTADGVKVHANDPKNSSTVQGKSP